MSCFERGEVVRIHVQGEWRKVVFVQHDPEYPRDQALVKWPFTRHVSRVMLSWLRTS